MEIKSCGAVEQESATERLVRWKRPLLWLIALFAVLHFIHLKADFPLHSQFAWEAAPMADEGWYSSSAVNEWLGRGWVLPGDFNPGVALPVWPAMALAAFHIGGMGIISLRTTEVLVFFVVVLLSYRLALMFEGDGIGLFAVFFLMTSSFCFAFSRLGFLEFPMMMFLMAAVLAIARKDRQTASRYVLAGVLTALSVLTKTLVVFLLPGLLYVAIERSNFQFVAATKRIACALGSCAVVLLAYYALYISHHQSAFNYLFTANMNGAGPSHLAEQIAALSRPLRKGWSTDILFFWVGVGSMIGAAVFPRLRYLWRRPLFVISQLWIFGYIVMMWLHNNATPRYYVPMLPALFFVGAMLLEALEVRWPTVAKVFLALLLVDAVVNVAETLYFVAQPTYTLLNASEGVRRVVSSDPGIIISHNAFELSLFTGLPGINQGYGEEPIRWRVAHYGPRWWVKQGFWDDGSMATQIGDQYRFEQVAEFPVLNHHPGYVVYRLVPIAE